MKRLCCMGGGGARRATAAGVSGAAGGRERQDNAYDKAGFLSFMELGGFDLRQDGAY